MLKKTTRILILLILCVSCRSEGPPPIFSVVEIQGRYEGGPIYRARMPAGWTCQKPADFLADTTKALAEFHDPSGLIRLTFHNFPFDTSQQQIPTMAQVSRWKKQFERLDPVSSSVTPQSFSGFIGYLFDGTGQISGEIKSVLGWAMQLAPEHIQHLQTPASRAEANRYRQIRASFTIKAVGPKELMAKEKNRMIAFAHSFELIDELPSQL